MLSSDTMAAAIIVAASSPCWWWPQTDTRSLEKRNTMRKHLIAKGKN